MSAMKSLKTFDWTLERLDNWHSVQSLKPAVSICVQGKMWMTTGGVLGSSAGYPSRAYKTAFSCEHCYTGGLWPTRSKLRSSTTTVMPQRLRMYVAKSSRTKCTWSFLGPESLPFSFWWVGGREAPHFNWRYAWACRQNSVDLVEPHSQRSAGMCAIYVMCSAKILDIHCTRLNATALSLLTLAPRCPAFT